MIHHHKKVVYIYFLCRSLKHTITICVSVYTYPVIILKYHETRRTRGHRYSMLTLAGMGSNHPRLYILLLFWAHTHPNIQKPIFGAIGIPSCVPIDLHEQHTVLNSS